MEVARRDRRALIATEATVKTHVAHVFSELGVRDRAQAVVVAYATGLLNPRRVTQI